MDKLKLLLTFGIIIGLIAAGFYWIAKDTEENISETTKYMKQGFKYSKGVVVKKNNYKGRTFEINYKINGLEYNYTGNWSYNRKSFEVGDSVNIKYATHNPKFIITELEQDY